MKKFILFAFAAIMTTLMSVGLTSCHNFGDKHSKSYFDSVDSTEIAHIATTAVFNPTFTDVDAFMDYANDQFDAEEFQCLIQSLSAKIVHSIATVVYKDHHKITPQLVVAEYRANKSIYDSIDSYENDLPGTYEESPSSRPEEPSPQDSSLDSYVRKLVKERRAD